LATEEWTLEVGDGIALVEAEVELVRVYAAWGGWHWEAEGVNEEDARRRLGSRLSLLNPFEGWDTDYGDPGYLLGELDPAIPKDTRKRMVSHDKWRQEINDRVNDRRLGGDE
jgi:hypothetical protein